MRQAAESSFEKFNLTFAVFSRQNVDEFASSLHLSPGNNEPDGPIVGARIPGSLPKTPDHVRAITKRELRED